MTIVTVIYVVYFLFLAALLVGWQRATRRKPDASGGKEPLISVVIPVRNEESTIENLLHDLSVQEYSNLEVIVVNDDSADETFWVVSRFNLRNLRLMHNKGVGKKAAITVGVNAARGGIIVTTDADCRVPPRWLQVLRAQFRNPRTMMTFGGVRMAAGDSFFGALQAIEFSSLIGSGAATAALQLPTMCNGANLAFRKKAFAAVRGYAGNSDIPSGDDEFLMRKIVARYPGSVVFTGDADAVVTTECQPDARTFYNQRIRWASKWRFNASLPAKVLAVIVVAFQIAFVANWFFVFTPAMLHALFLMCVKMILEGALLLQVCRFLNVRWNWLAFFALQLLYPCYVIVVSAASFFQPFQWKNRIFKPF